MKNSIAIYNVSTIVPHDNGVEVTIDDGSVITICGPIYSTRFVWESDDMRFVEITFSGKAEADD